MHTHSS